MSRARWRNALGLVAASALASIAVAHFWPGSTDDDALAVRVIRRDLVVRLTETGVLKPARSFTYRSPVPGRELEIIQLAPEGVVVGEGDLIVRLDATELRRDLERAQQELRQAQLDEQLADLEEQEARGDLEALEAGESGEVLSGEEEEVRRRLLEKRVERLRDELAALEPILERGFITREELDATAFELEQAETELWIARRKAEVYEESTLPREIESARRRLAQAVLRSQNAKAHREAAESRVAWLAQSIQNCSVYAREPGLVVYEEYLGANPRRKIQVGDRITPSQGLVTIPGVAEMLVETSVREADLHRVEQGQPVSVRVDAFPDLKLSGRVLRVGTLARTSSSGLLENKRFDVIVELDSIDAELRPEMTARVSILVEERRGVLVAPVNAVFELDGGYVARVMGSWGVETRPVELGETDGVFVEIRSGIEEGARLSLEHGDGAVGSAEPEGASNADRESFKGRLAPTTTGPLTPR